MGYRFFSSSGARRLLAAVLKGGTGTRFQGKDGFNVDWRSMVWAAVVDARAAALLRESQATLEAEYLNGLPPCNRKAAALELIGLYHLVKAAEVRDAREIAVHIDAAREVCKHARLIDLEEFLEDFPE